MSFSDATEPACEASATDDISLVIQGRPRPVGNVTVTRVLPTIARQMIGPFIFLDHMGPVRFPAGAGFDVLPHPHIGLSTVTYLFEGEAMHRDSLGNVQAIVPGDVNLMTAGRGIVHSERSTEARRAIGDVMHGLQFWVALTEQEEDAGPSFTHVRRVEIPRHEEGDVSAAVVLGEAFGLTSPLRHASRPVMVDAQLPKGSIFRSPPAAVECGLYVVTGSVRIGARSIGPRTLAVLSRAEVGVCAEEDSRIIALGGPALGRRFIDWNFVSSSRERIEQAKQDWRERRFPSIPGDDTEFVPLPEPRRAT